MIFLFFDNQIFSRHETKYLISRHVSCSCVPGNKSPWSKIQPAPNINNQKPAAPATSHQPPATSHQPPATSR
jgi:hypothetical protein